MGLNTKEATQISRLYEEMYSSLCVYAMSALEDRRLAEEAVQDAFRIACAKKEELLSSRNPKGWITNTLKNVIRNIRRTRARLNNMVVSGLSIEGLGYIGSENYDSFELYYSDALGNEDWELLKMFVLQNYTMLEAARELGISVEACKKRVQRARKKLEIFLENS
ncbi:MAG: sigma-70 family RNA polymerase sigma factor [Oscillospiraceae bacterium]|nr:sigma-70 family RNA polymerase sigma factor [Oscillospiraceae bacterium]